MSESKFFVVQVFPEEIKLIGPFDTAGDADYRAENEDSKSDNRAINHVIELQREYWSPPVKHFLGTYMVEIHRPDEE